MSNKFDSELAERLYNLSLDSSQNDSVGNADELGWFARFDDELAIVGEYAAGFVTVWEYPNPEALSAAWQHILDDYADYNEDEEAYGFGYGDDGDDGDDEGDYDYDPSDYTDVYEIDL